MSCPPNICDLAFLCVLEALRQLGSLLVSALITYGLCDSLSISCGTRGMFPPHPRLPNTDHLRIPAHFVHRLSLVSQGQGTFALWFLDVTSGLGVSPFTGDTLDVC